ncbi:MAG: DUF3168 domain-containing protein [Wolbachia endosymbiont of Tyrophagus putrescentiae]|nr:DUF3168 domain-containing protein [Wolbachia endosymbiont of Tyrophagus putrescentiae]
MEKIQTIYNNIYSMLKDNTELNKHVTNIYNYLPKTVTIPYLRLYVAGYNMLSQSSVKAKLSCDVYTYQMDNTFNIIKCINSTIQNIKCPNNAMVVQNNCTIIQNDEILHSIINFNIFITGDINEQIAIEN